MTHDQDRIVAEVIAERTRQDQQWGGADHDREHSDNDWLEYIRKQVSRGLTERHKRQRFIKIAALCFAKLEAE